MSELRPCPFCGEKDSIVRMYASEKKTHFVRCMMCRVDTAEFITEYAAIAAWNRRAESPELSAMTADRDRARQANETNAAGYLACADQRQAAERQLAAALNAVKRRDGVIEWLITMILLAKSPRECRYLIGVDKCPDATTCMDCWRAKIKTKLEN